MTAPNLDPELCHKYARFAAHLARRQFRIVYWLLFGTNLFILFLASWAYIKGQETVERLKDQPTKRRRALRLYTLICFVCTVISMAIVVMQAFALLALQFCDGEDLMSLYWSTWTMVQVGSLIAICGIVLAQAHSLRERRHPPWALALGTPVLVIAGLLHLVHDCTKKRIKSQTRRFSKEGMSISQSPTIADLSEGENTQVEGELIGFSVEGGPIIRFTNAEPPSMPAGRRLGTNAEGDSLFVFDSETLQLISKNRSMSS